MTWDYLIFNINTTSKTPIDNLVYTMSDPFTWSSFRPSRSEQQRFVEWLRRGPTYTRHESLTPIVPGTPQSLGTRFNKSGHTVFRERERKEREREGSHKIHK